jgi:Family of unknown function (DUF6527)
MKRPLWIRTLFRRLSKPARKYQYKRVEEPPVPVDKGTIYIVQDSKEPDTLVFKCPCGCDRVIQLNLLRDTEPCWHFYVRDKYISIRPSVFSKKGCGSHFWITRNRVIWAG